jgi:hypothetical protein
MQERADGFTTEGTEEHRGQRALISVNLCVLCGEIFRGSIRHPLNAIFQPDDIEIDQQPDLLVA